MIELLAPAKDKNCAKAAIDFGADAIYIGASEFGARKNVPNSLLDIKEIVDYAHKFGVKVYVTLNTILTDEELERAKKLAAELKKIKVDALIIQDLGLVETLAELGFEYHASTQCDNREIEKIEFLKAAGFSRVVLARELSVEKIREIKKAVDVELEAFIHGALCVSYSGQCYLSQLIGGRSANRGECAQPCRKKYSLVDENGKIIAKDKYLLCLKDFNASKHLKTLANAGITSFKIEGRLKDESYVKNVVGYYRKLIDELNLGSTSDAKVFFDLEPDLEKSFNRGFTEYFLDGKRKKIFNFETPKSMGQYIGKIKKLGLDFFEIDAATTKLSPQDGLCFFLNADLSGCLVNKIEKNKIFPNKMNGLKVGTEIYRNFDAEFEKKLKNSKTCRKISIHIEFDDSSIRAVDNNGNEAKIKYEFEELAQNQEKMKENIKSQLKKTGECIFHTEKIDILCEKLPFLPVSALNELRRKLFHALESVRLEKYASTKAKPQTIPQKFEKELDYRANIMNKSAKNFYENLGFTVKEMALEKCEAAKSDKSGKTAMTCKHCLKYAFNMCKSPEKLFLVDEKGKKYELKFDCKKCEMEVIY